MTIIGWLLLAEVIAAIVLVGWFLYRAHKRVKHSPAEQALIQHLAELEQAKAQEKTDHDTVHSNEADDTSSTHTVNNNEETRDNNDAIKGSELW